MLKIAICDDSMIDLELLHDYFDDFNEVSTFKVQTATFSTGSELIDAVNAGSSFDIFILDMLMPELNGIETAEKLRELGIQGRIIFLTSDPGFVFKAFEVEASGYLLKPVDPEMLFETIRRIRTKIESEQPSSAIIRTADGVVNVLIRDIIYIDRFERSLRFHLTDGSIILEKPNRAKFKEVVHNFLDSEGFVLSSVGVAVNLSNVTSLKPETNEIILVSGERLLCSRTMISCFKADLENYWSGEADNRRG